MHRIDEKEFDIEFMKEHGYKRMKCRSCGSYFWGFSDDLCGESPCVEYTFLDNPPTRRKYTLREMRKAFLKFFEKHGHEILNPYPVIARWRDDLLITIASIADFQPYVTAGISEPPANPLVISQPCLRFEDIDKVGYTSGRHLTIFEMGGAHAFNDMQNNKIIYWKNETIKYHHEFATKELGIPEDLITYKEHFWMGGGNAGPDVEGIISGLEVSTLVFMKYRVEPDGKLVEIPIWTVDTGYGIERWTWLSTGYPTAFEAIYNNLYHWILKYNDLNIPRDILKSITKKMSLLKVFSVESLQKILKRVSHIHDYPYDILINDYLKFVDLMKLLDFSKSALFLIKDGGVPSNVKEGYLTRMLLRRIFKISENYHLDFNFIEELFTKQFKLWRNDYPELDMIDESIYKIIELEYNKYKDIIKRVPSLISSYLRRKKWRGLDTLIEIYDSYGVPPEFVAKEVSKYGIKIEVPQNFTELVSKRHLQHKKPIIEEKVKGTIPGEYKTVKLYYQNPYWRNVIATITYKGDNFVILDKTIFYPGGGGQSHDTGYLISPDGNRYKISRVESYNDAILHYIDGNIKDLKNGQKVILMLDWDRRYQIMKHHTATHILLSAIRRVLGGHIWQAGAEKTDKYARLDVTHYESLSLDTIEKIEKEANKIISSCLDVSVKMMERGVAEKKYGPIIYQGGVVQGKYIRIVEIPGWDVEACAGIHVKNTCELQIIKILNVEKIHDGVIRFVYVAGDTAHRHIWNYYKIGEYLKSSLSVSLDEVPKKINELLMTVKELNTKLSNMTRELIKFKAYKLLEKPVKIGNYNVYVVKDDINNLIMLGEELDNLTDEYLLVGYTKAGKGYNVIVRIGDKYMDQGLSAKEIMNYFIKEILKGGGKGTDKYSRFGGVGTVDKDKIIEVISKYVE